MNVHQRLAVQARERGVTLIELMIAVTIGSLLTLAVTTLLAEAENRRRVLLASDDMVQIGNYAMLQLDQAIRSAGSGFATGNQKNLGCSINAVKNGATLLPAPATALPAPFNALPASIGGRFRLAPVIIVANGSGFTSGQSDVLIVMRGGSGYAENATRLTGAAGSTDLYVTSSFGFKNSNNAAVGDLLLIADVGGGTVNPCLISQVSPATSFTPSAATLTIPLAGSYFVAAGPEVALSAFGADSTVTDLGNPAGGNAPQFQLLGVNPTSTDSTTASYALYSYDLLGISSPGAAIAVADQLFELHALYFVDGNGDGVAESWVSPDPASGASVLQGLSYDAASLMAGTSGASDALRRIKAIRLGVIVRSPLRQKDAVAAATTLSLFQNLSSASGASLAYTRNLTGAEANFRYRSLEMTVPIRNALF